MRFFIQEVLAPLYSATWSMLRTTPGIAGIALAIGVVFPFALVKDWHR